MIELDLVAPQKERILSGIEREQASNKIVAELLENLNPSSAYLLIYQMEKIINEAKSSLKEKVLYENIPKEGLSIQGATLKIVGIPSDYTYPDPVVQDLEARLKLEKEFCKRLQKEMADTLTGEIRLPAVRVKSGNTIKVTIPR